ncbi:hypothetical protein JL107_11110 [Nakamurella flavida]|uniref:SAF domain-containing protein n=1 Tax=Nakamurella flavida TaxID=363630 RepID=A0A938YP96_9ACTN|nr:SAF domain-containing protein [Nakamurella flavida]MBM9476997.1 hypothetical protein [Nakamurella flavida]MDP9779942.1 hypothetical protein [Nakamurella flavida]
MGQPAAPTPRRMARPRWLNLRVVLGLALVAVAVVAGATVVGGSARTVPVWAANRDLAAGTVLTGADLVRVDVNLGQTGTHYLGADADPPTGRSVVAPVATGELLAVSDIEAPPSGRVVVVGVGADRMPPGVDHGSVVDLYLTTAGAGTGDPVQTELIEQEVTVQSVTAPDSGGLSAASSDAYQLALLLPSDQADELVRTLLRGDVTVVLVSGS